MNSYAPDPREMVRLREMLDKAGVEYYTIFDSTDDFDMRGYTMRSLDFEVGGGICLSGFSVILTPFSYGGSDGLLELWAKGMDEPVGWLGADNVMDGLRAVGIVGKTTRRD